MTNGEKNEIVYLIDYYNFLKVFIYFNFQKKIIKMF